MPRPDRPLSPGADPVQQLAWDLRKLRDQAGGPTYQALARKTQAGPDPRSSTTLSDAAGGQTCPSWATLAAFVTACGGRPSEWRDRWQQAQAWRPGHDKPSQAVADLDRSESSRPPPLVDELPGDQQPTVDAPPDSHQPVAAQEPTVEIAQVSAITSRFHLSGTVGNRPRWWWRDRRLRVGAGAVIAAVAMGAAGVLLYSGPTLVSGTVTCTDGGAVVGVWVKAEEGDSGYASFMQSTDPERADFQYRLTKKARWTVNVGCGGTTQNWLHQVHGVMMTSATRQNWKCDSDRGHYGCRTA